MKFNYQARNKKGETQSGVIEASSKEAALQLLSKYGLFVTILEGTKDAPIYAKEIGIFKRTSFKDILLFSRQLSIMFQSRVPLIEALRVLSSQTKNSAFKEKIMKISEDVEGGTSFSQAISQFPSMFSPFYINMVKSGEASGKLSEVLDYLADHLEQEYNMKSKIKGAMVYPSFIVVMVVSVLFLLMFFVLPSLIKVLEESGGELPAATKLVIASTGFLRSWWWLMLILIMGGIVGIIKYRKTVEGKRIFDKIFLMAPLFGPFVKMVQLTRFAENLSTLIAGGLPIVQALDITGKILGNTIYQEIVFEAKEAVQQGNTISSVLQKHPTEFPPIFNQMVFVGEKSGTLDSTLKNVVVFYQKEVERGVEVLLNILEPLLIVGLGLAIGGIMAAVLLPLYQMSM